MTGSGDGTYPPAHGRHKVYLGFAAGVGKTCEMLSEANRRLSRGQDVVIGYVETHGRRATQDAIGQLPAVPPKRVEYRGATFEEMDTEAILARHPRWVLVDELAHTNVPGSPREKRWQDVEALLAAGINVLSTVNVQHLESLNDTVADVTGIRVRETVPDRILADAEEVVMVDITPHALLNRLERGDIYKPEAAQRARESWFREPNLVALREIALREVAHEVEDEATTGRAPGRAVRALPTHDRLMICIGATPASLRLLRRGWRIAQRMHADATAVHVSEPDAPPQSAEVLRTALELAHRLEIPVVTLEGDPAEALAAYAREHGITQVLVGRGARGGVGALVRPRVDARLLRLLPDTDVLVLARRDGQP